MCDSDARQRAGMDEALVRDAVSSLEVVQLRRGAPVGLAQKLPQLAAL